jgi:hypothetical protein
VEDQKHRREFPNQNAPPGNEGAVEAGTSTGTTSRSVGKARSVTLRATWVDHTAEPYSYYLSAAGIDWISAREGTSAREFVDRLLGSGLAVTEGDGLRV